MPLARTVARRDARAGASRDGFTAFLDSGIARYACLLFELIAGVSGDRSAAVTGSSVSCEAGKHTDLRAAVFESHAAFARAWRYSNPAPRAHWYFAPRIATGSSAVYGQATMPRS